MTAVSEISKSLLSNRSPSKAWSLRKPTALLVFADGMALEGDGFGAEGAAVGEVCFNTAMTGYQEILTDPSYAGQIITFTFPHIGIVGTNDDDSETANAASPLGVRGAVMRDEIGDPSNFRAAARLDVWMKAHGIIGICGVDTRALTAMIRNAGMPNGVIAHNAKGEFDRAALASQAAQWPGIDGMDLAPSVTTAQAYQWRQKSWSLGGGYRDQDEAGLHVVAIDYGVKRNILRLLADSGCAVTVVPATTSAEAILALKPDGVFLSNGPGDPAETGIYAVPTIRALLEAKMPIFGICLGHQMLGLAVGGRTIKMPQGHHGANHPVKDFTTHKVEIVSMNHGFALDAKSLPNRAVETHVSLFDGSNCGIALADAPAFSVQHHPEASPGPRDSHYLFRRFVGMMRQSRAAPAPI